MKSERPVVVVGMHRSGTSIVAEMLSELGVHMGHFQDTNHEPRVYVALNNWILRQAGTSWEYPLEINRLLDNRTRSSRRRMRSAAMAYDHRLAVLLL